MLSPYIIFRKMNDKPHLSKIGPLNLLFPMPATNSSHLKDFHSDYNENSAKEEGKLRVSDRAEDKKNEPKKREVLAYKIEYASKIVYPVLFGFFNLSYWSYYLHYYAISEQLFSV